MRTAARDQAMRDVLASAYERPERVRDGRKRISACVACWKTPVRVFALGRCQSCYAHLCNRWRAERAERSRAA